VQPDAVDGLHDELRRLFGASPAGDLHPLVGLEVLVVLEEVLDLPERDVGQIEVRLHTLIAERQARHRNSDDFFIAPCLVLHLEHAHRADGYDGPGHDATLVGDEHVAGVAIVGQRVRNKPVITGVTHRRVEKSIDDEGARRLVHLVLDRRAADVNLDDDVDFAGGVSPDLDGIDSQRVRLLEREVLCDDSPPCRKVGGGPRRPWQGQTPKRPGARRPPPDARRPTGRRPPAVASEYDPGAYRVWRFGVLAATYQGGDRSCKVGWAGEFCLIHGNDEMTATHEERVVRARARVGSVLNAKYRLDRVVGVGGMAAVYAATHLRNASRVAVKVLHPEMAADSNVRARFLREGYAANSVEHPGTVRILDDDSAEDGTVFLVDQVLDVLATAHDKGIVHRDIKPENLFLTRAGTLKLLDFGIARLIEAPVTATRPGGIVGTPAFMAPEQVLGKAVDAQSDLYAVGATAFALLSKRYVHEAENAGEM